MSTTDSSLDYLADNLMSRLDRNKIFPPQLNNPENLLPVTYNRMTPPTRPPNGFLLCRKNVHHEARLQGQCNMRVISKVTGILWRNATAEEKEMYEELANRVSIVYAQRYHGEEPHDYCYHQIMPYPYLPHYAIPPQNIDYTSASFQPDYLIMTREHESNGGHVFYYNYLEQ